MGHLYCAIPKGQWPALLISRKPSMACSAALPVLLLRGPGHSTRATNCLAISGKQVEWTPSGRTSAGSVVTPHLHMPSLHSLQRRRSTHQHIIKHSVAARVLRCKPACQMYMQCLSVVQCDAMHAMRCDAVSFDMMRCDATFDVMRCHVLCDAMLCLRCDAMRCHVLRCDAMRCDALTFDVMQ